MGYNELEIELKKTLAQIARWRELGYMPTIEQGIALSRLQNVYAGLLDLPCGEPESALEMVEEPTVEEPDEQQPEEVVGQDEERLSDETHLVQEYGAHDTTVVAVEILQPAAEDQSEEEEVLEEQVEIMVEEIVEEEVESVEDAEESAEEVTPAPVSESAPVKKPSIFGIEVNAYARHEIIDTLFHGNIDLFEVEVAKINDMSTFEDALVYIGEMYNWVPENAATIKFIDLLEVRFGE